MPKVPVPKKLARGPKWARKAYNDLLAYAIAVRPVKGKNTTVTESESGTVINAHLPP